MPILVCHGTKDDMVGFDCGEAGAKALRTKFAVDFERIPGLQHSSCPKELRAVANFVHRALGGAGDLRVPEWEKGGAGFGSDDEAWALGWGQLWAERATAVCPGHPWGAVSFACRVEPRS